MSYRSAQDPEDNLPEWLRSLRKRQEQENIENPENEAAVAESKPASEQPEPPEDPDGVGEIRTRYQRGKKPAATADEEADLEDTKPRRFEPVYGPPAPVEQQPQAPFISLPEEGEIPSPTAAFNQDEPALTPGELPGWLQALRPGASFPKEDSRSGEILPGAENAGPLAGLSNVLPADLSITQVERTPVFSSRLEITEHQGLHAAAFKKLLSEVEAPPEDETSRVARPTRVLNILMASALLLAVLFPLLTQSQSAIRPDPQFFPEAISVYGMIDVLPAEAPVLVAFEVQPALIGEMTPLISAVFAHLLDRQAQLVFISTRPNAPALAERVLQEQLAAAPVVASGAYTQLGYLSGGTVAIRSFISDPRSAILSTAAGPDPWKSPGLEPIQQLSNFALVLVVSSNAEDARAWIEQGAGFLPSSLAAVTSAQAAPLLRTYLRSKPQTLHGLVSGLQGAALYERLRGQDGLGRAYWDAYSYGLGAIVLMILLGGLYGRLIQLKPEKPMANEAGRGA